MAVFIDKHYCKLILLSKGNIIEQNNKYYLPGTRAERKMMSSSAHKIELTAEICTNSNFEWKNVSESPLSYFESP